MSHFLGFRASGVMLYASEASKSDRGTSPLSISQNKHSSIDFEIPESLGRCDSFQTHTIRSRYQVVRDGKVK